MWQNVISLAMSLWRNDHWPYQEGWKLRSTAFFCLKESFGNLNFTDWCDLSGMSWSSSAIMNVAIAESYMFKCMHYASTLYSNCSLLFQCTIGLGLKLQLTVLECFVLPSTIQWSTLEKSVLWLGMRNARNIACPAKTSVKGYFIPPKFLSPWWYSYTIPGMKYILGYFIPLFLYLVYPHVGFRVKV